MKNKKNNRFKFRVFYKQEAKYLKQKYINIEGKKIKMFSPANGIGSTLEHCIENTQWFIVEQFIGLEDEKGNDIFEGDLLKDNKKQIGKVFFNKKSARFEIVWTMNDGSFQTDDCFGCGVIVGNINENKDLFIV